MERDRTDRTGWTSRRGRTDAMGGRETRISNNEHRILNGEAEIGGVLRGGWFNRFLDKLGMTRAALGMTRTALGMTRTGDGNLAHSAPLRTCFGWGVREISNFKLQIANFRYPRSRAQVAD